MYGLYGLTAEEIAVVEGATAETVGAGTQEAGEVAVLAGASSA